MSRSGYLKRENFTELLRSLTAEGYQCVGPTVNDGAIEYSKIQNPSQLPKGYELAIEPGQVRTVQKNHDRYFAWPNSAQGLKPWLFKARETLWCAHKTDTGFVFNEPIIEAPAIAYIGARACDLAALQLHDLHFMFSDFADPYYAARRKALLIVGVNCSHAGSTCFCASTNDGPEIFTGYDLLLDELDDGFIVHFGSEKGLAIFEQLPLVDMSANQEANAKSQLAQVVASQERELLHENMHANIFANLDSDEWHRIATTCLACGNCTSVCPTCFCHREIELAALDGKSSTHLREWDSCFTQDHSYIHGLTIRDEPYLRYRQWMSHKLGSWREQYDRSGCTGCGRCIAWCPVGIDFVAEANLVSGDI